MTHAELTALDVMGAAPIAATCHCGADLHKAAEIEAGICVECYQSDPIAACVAGRSPWPDMIAECVRGRSVVPCRCGQHYDLVRGRCAACWAGRDPRARGLWRSVAIEARVDERDEAANDRAEREEWKEAREAEWAAEQGEEIVEVGNE